MRTEITHAPFRPVYKNFDWPKNDDLIIQIWSEETLEVKAALIYQYVGVLTRNLNGKEYEPTVRILCDKLLADFDN